MKARNESGLGDRNNNGNMNITLSPLQETSCGRRRRRLGYRVSFEGEKAATKGVIYGERKGAVIRNYVMGRLRD